MKPLRELFDLSLLARMVDEGFVSRRAHASLPLVILNYTDRCQYERDAWNDVTRQCRGLIVTDAGEVVARPFPKFFNWGQSGAPTLDLTAPVTVTDKLDGSLGVLYPHGELHSVATRGSFESEQAIHATDLWDARYANTPVPDGWTLLFEIIYPENRIVCDYGPLDDLVLLGAMEIATGCSVGPHDALLVDWPGPRATVFDYATLADALAATPRPNAEGLVVHCVTGDRVKIKQEDYVKLHRIVTGLNERTVWEHVSTGQPLGDLIAPLPDEFHEWTIACANRMVGAVVEREKVLRARFDDLAASLPQPTNRKEFALAAKATPDPWAMFALLDGKPLGAQLWKEVYPAGRIGPRPQHDEATA